MSGVKHDFSGIGPECDCPAEPYRHRHIEGSQTADLTPAQAITERVTRAMWEAVAVGRTEQSWLSQHDLKTLAVAAIDAMRGAADDGACVCGRSRSACTEAFLDYYRQHPVGAPATAEVDNRG